MFLPQCIMSNREGNGIQLGITLCPQFESADDFSKWRTRKALIGFHLQLALWLVHEICCDHGYGWAVLAANATVNVNLWSESETTRSRILNTEETCLTSLSLSLAQAYRFAWCHCSGASWGKGQTTPLATEPPPSLRFKIHNHNYAIFIVFLTVLGGQIQWALSLYICMHAWGELSVFQTHIHCLTYFFLMRILKP